MPRRTLAALALGAFALAGLVPVAAALGEAGAPQPRGARQAEIQHLRERLEDLEDRLSDLEARVAELEERCPTDGARPSIDRSPSTPPKPNPRNRLRSGGPPRTIPDESIPKTFNGQRYYLIPLQQKELALHKNGRETPVTK